MNTYIFPSPAQIQTEYVTEELVRELRNEYISETDWWASTDLTMTDAQTAYRQALRDVPEQEGFPDSVVWPIKPE
tara:strand:- start:1664 stop:1888 length:225 start_codon:yes stop_codon:yes gene_type:complete